MKKIKSIFFISSLLFAQSLFAQTTAQLQETAAAFMRTGDYNNAVLVLSRAMQSSPQDLSVQKQLAQAYYYQGNYPKALEIIKPVLDNDKADDQSFLIAGNIYLHLEQPKDAQSTFKKGIKKFENSGPLYNALGEVQFNDRNYDAIKNWEKGIATDPSYSRNYFNAARFYFLTKDKVWSILYGEIFVNMEPNSNLTSEMKEILLDSYKKYYIDALKDDKKKKSVFETAYTDVMSKQAGLASQGITTESLSMIRTRFIVDWFAEKNRPAFKLFELEQQLLKEGMFEAYNQWLFGTAENLSSYANWVKTHESENNAFLNFQKNRVFKIPEGQYYR